MAKRRREEDDNDQGDYLGDKPKKQPPTFVIAMGIFLGLVHLAGIFVGAWYIVKSRFPQLPVQQVQKTQYERSEFRKMVIGLTADQVREKFGNPVKVGENNGVLDHYVFHDLTYHADATQPDTVILVFFDDKGIVKNTSR